MVLRTTGLVLFVVPAVLVTAHPPAEREGYTAEADVGQYIAWIKAVGTKGTGNTEAAHAWNELVRLGPNVLVDLLTALNDADPLAANWLRNAFDAIAERALADGQPLPADKLEAFVKHTRNAGKPRRLAFEWLTRVDAGARERLLPAMLTDPGSELRREAVERSHQRALELLEKGEKEKATTRLRELFKVARERDQVDRIAKDLKKLGVAVDVTAHYGFITRWMLIGPFDNSKMAGFAKTYDPEREIKLDAGCHGKAGKDVRWIAHHTADPNGLVDLNKAIGKNMGAVAYAFAVVHVPREVPVQIRAASNNAVKIFLNGKEIYFREEYHHGIQMDQHVGKGVLKPGRNEVMIKVCQNEQTDTWAQTWSFQLRICDDLGGAVPFTVQAKDLDRQPDHGEVKR
jgi:hypothetical protein